MKKLLMMFFALLTVMVGNAAGRKINIMDLPPFERVGYGHRVLPGEPYRRGVQLTEKQADALLRKDLRKFISLYKAYGKDALLLGVLAYNCGPGVVNKSTVLKKLKSGNRDIFKSYISHCRYKGKFHKQLHQRRIIEYLVLFTS